MKTRLAATVGNEKALSIYKTLIGHTLEVVKESGFHALLFYYPEISPDKDLSIPNSSKYVQQGSDLGERMLIAFETALQNYDQAIILGTDCPYIDSNLIGSAFKALEETDIVVGPATDGGYYLLGLKHPHPQLFENMKWSTEAVLEETLKRSSNLGLKYAQMTTLSDIDYEEDWQRYQKWLRDLQS